MSSAGAGGPDINDSEDPLFYENTLVMSRVDNVDAPGQSRVVLENGEEKVVLNSTLMYLDGETGDFYPYELDPPVLFEYAAKQLGTPMSTEYDPADPSEETVLSLNNWLDGLLTEETLLIENQKPFVFDGTLPKEISEHTPSDNAGFGMAIDTPTGSVASSIDYEEKIPEPSWVENITGVLAPAPAPADDPTYNELVKVSSARLKPIDEEALMLTYNKTSLEIDGEIKKNTSKIESETTKRTEILKRVLRLRPKTEMPLEPVLEQQKKLVIKKAVKTIKRSENVIETAGRNNGILNTFNSIVKTSGASVRRMASSAVAPGNRSAKLFEHILDDTNKQLVRIYVSKKIMLDANDGKLSCYICGEEVIGIPEFEHLMHFLASLTKGLLSSKEKIEQIGTEVFIQRCVAEWACAVCNGKSGKSQDDLTTHSKLGADRKDWGDIKPNTTAIEALLTRVWGKFLVDKDTRLKMKYTNLANFISFRKTSISERFRWNCEIVKKYVDFNKYNECKNFLNTLNLAKAKDPSIDFENFMIRYLNEKSPLKIDYLPTFSSVGVDNPLKSKSMFLNKQNSLEQSHDGTTHPVKNLDSTHGAAVMKILFGAAAIKRPRGGTLKRARAASRRQQQKLTRKRRRGPQVTVEIVPYRSARA